MYNKINAERGATSAGAGMTIAGLFAVYMVGQTLGRLTENASERVHDVQIHNEQLTDQVEPLYPHMGRLIITDDKAKTFRFENVDTQNTQQVCTGEYEVDNDRAHAVGAIACTSEQKVSR